MNGKGEVTKVDDIRQVVPVFFSQSVICYLHLINMLTNHHGIISDSEYIYEYCRYIAKGSYLNMDYFQAKVSGENKRKMEKFKNIMYECLEDEEYGD